MAGAELVEYDEAEKWPGGRATQLTGSGPLARKRKLPSFFPGLLPEKAAMRPLNLSLYLNLGMVLLVLSDCALGSKEAMHSGGEISKFNNTRTMVFRIYLASFNCHCRSQFPLHCLASVVESYRAANFTRT
jgi:hypothetical protein